MSTPEPKPRDPKKARIYTRMRCSGSTQKEAAKTAGVSERTGQSWEASTWWGDAVGEARDDLDVEILFAARGAVLAALRDGDAATARWALERLCPETYGPPKQRREIEVTSPLDGIDFATLTDEQLSAIERGEVPEGLVH